jgi:hypothetical protein
MKLKQYPAIVILAVICFITGLSSVSAQDNDLVSLLDRISERIDSYPGNNYLKCMVVTKTTQTDKRWQPNGNTTTSRSIVKIIDNTIKKEILEVLQTENGKTRDVTKEYIKNMDAMQEGIKNKDVDRELENNKDIPQAAARLIEAQLEESRKDLKDAEKKSKEKGKDETETEYLPFMKESRPK